MLGASPRSSPRPAQCSNKAATESRSAGSSSDPASCPATKAHGDPGSTAANCAIPSSHERPRNRQPGPGCCCPLGTTSHLVAADDRGSNFSSRQPRSEAVVASWWPERRPSRCLGQPCWPLLLSARKRGCRRHSRGARRDVKAGRDDALPAPRNGPANDDFSADETARDESGQAGCASSKLCACSRHSGCRGRGCFGDGPRSE